VNQDIFMAFVLLWGEPETASGMPNRKETIVHSPAQTVRTFQCALYITFKHLVSSRAKAPRRQRTPILPESCAPHASSRFTDGMGEFDVGIGLPLLTVSVGLHLSQ
jgi:hypothetical protein